MGADPVQLFEADGRQECGPIGEVEGFGKAVTMQKRGVREVPVGTGGPAAHRNDAFAGQSLRLKLGGVVEDSPFDDDIHAGRSGVLHAEPVSDDDVDLGGPPAEQLKSRDQPIRREERRYHDQQPLAARVPAHSQDRAVDHLEGRLQVVSQALAIGGQAHAATVPLQDGDSEIVLELLDMAADRAGRHRELVAGERYGAEPRNRFECAQGIEGRQTGHRSLSR